MASEQERLFWMAIRRAILMVSEAIKVRYGTEQVADNLFWMAIRRAILMIADAIKIRYGTEQVADKTS